MSFLQKKKFSLRKRTTTSLTVKSFNINEMVTQRLRNNDKTSDLQAKLKREPHWYCTYINSNLLLAITSSGVTHYTISIFMMLVIAKFFYLTISFTSPAYTYSSLFFDKSGLIQFDFAMKFYSEDSC